jgi:beta-glucanase (GH16 family)
LPRRNSYGQWPASGEIDIMESRGNANYPQSSGGGVESFGSTLHWGPEYSVNRYLLTHEDYHHTAKLSDEFHTYGLYWSEDRLYTYFDDPSNIILDIDTKSKSFWERGAFPNYFNNPWEGRINAPFDQEYYIIINLAVGGTAGYFADGVAGKPWSDKSSSSVNQFYDAKAQWWPTWTKPFVIDSVKVWSL